ncbi:hypothetical protein BDZ45DRAFT_800510 [Acephala macrosclerotiorum]|nr:hypothetical protein BDZ45DRAFT_800510 [Acephala macrosclerotiorum]
MNRLIVGYSRLLSYEDEEPMEFEDLRDACFDGDEAVESDLSSETMGEESDIETQDDGEEEKVEEEEESRRGKYPRLTIATTSVANARNIIIEEQAERKTEEQSEEDDDGQGAIYWKQKYNGCKIRHQLSNIEVARQKLIIDILEERCADQLRTIDDLSETGCSLNEQILDWEEAYNEKYEEVQRMRDLALENEKKVVGLERQLEKATMYKGRKIRRLEDELQRRHELAGEVCDGYEMVLRKQDARVKELEGMFAEQGVATTKEVSKEEMEKEGVEASVIRKRKMLLISP